MITFKQNVRDEKISGFRQFREDLKLAAHSKPIIVFTTFIIIVHCTCFILSSNREFRLKYGFQTRIIDALALGVYTEEFLIKICGNGFAYFQNHWDLIDFVALSVSWFEFILIASKFYISKNL
ncbi:hypothetical protein GJ496_002565 [Pomphorhynchus laevis]|nr:hypothetical protein GJ496_002565 [Pomphorhynchus laevis]